MYITLFISTLHNIDDISFVLLYGSSSRKNNIGQSELTEKKAMVPSAAANTC